MQLPSRSRFVGCLWGGALGDALGYPIEFDGPGRALIERYGATAPARLRFCEGSAGLVSDDTQMTLFTAEALIRARLAGEATPNRFLLTAYQRWYATQAMRPALAPLTRAPLGQGLLLADARLHARRAPGNTCLAALSASFMGRPLPTLEAPPNDSKGCGAVMRSAPFGLLADSGGEAFRHARDAAVLTHGHPSGYLSSAYFAALVFDLARGSSPAVCLDRADELLAHERESEELRDIMARARALVPVGPPSPESLEQLGGGWTGEEALAIAVLCAFTAAGPDQQHTREALWRSVAHGGDSDSTGSLTGNLLGAMHGVEALPGAWLAELEMTDLIERVASDLRTVRDDPGALDASAYPLQ